MKKPITITEAMMQEMAELFRAECERAKLADGRVSFSREYKFPDTDDRKAKIHFTADAYEKMTKVIDAFSSEVAWHGFVERVGDMEFIVTDILVYPQMVTGATVNTDQEEYTKWLDTIDVEEFNKMHFQGHSHVYMATHPSSVDLGHQSEIIKQLKKDDFYIFMIWNKKREFTAKVYDMATNTLFDGSDVEVTYEPSPVDEFIEDAKAMVRTRTYTAPTTPPANAATTPGSRYYQGQKHWWDEEDDDADDEFDKGSLYTGKGGKKNKKRGKGGNDVYTGGLYVY